ncbi:MAG TPA: peptidase S13 [Gammaproteobacteria bacterium]|nr:peptidase S13 [Gammaproteobacteria bacterium]
MIFRIALVLLLSTSQVLVAGSVTDRVSQLRDASFLLQTADGRVLRSHLSSTPRVPASILKILTAWLALEHWGGDYHFVTEFFLDKDQLLWIKGYGDPVLVSEELERIAEVLKKRGLGNIKGIGTDAGFYAPDIAVDGQAGSSNPYDAPVAALLANFNTVNLDRKNGEITSAEPQTPLTETAKKLGKTLTRDGVQRINLQDQRSSETYLAEILRHKLIDAGVRVGKRIESGQLPDGARLIYRHKNSKPLRDVIQAMLKYSTNLIANQIFLDLGAAAYGPPATMDKAVSFAREKIAESLGWKDYVIAEGAGLSRRNRLSVQQMITLLRQFEPYKNLLPRKQPRVRAKTGTLNGVRSYAGYIESDRGSYPFAIIFNRAVKRDLRYRLVQEWKNNPGGK